MDLILYVCLVAAPATCREEHVSIGMESTAPVVCAVGAPPIIAEWAGTHPKWRVRRWRCGSPERHERDA